MGRLFDYAVMPLLLPFLLLWLLAARLLSLLAPLLLPPLSIALNRKLVWACPFIPSIWAEKGWLKGSLMRLGFEYSYTAVSVEWCMGGWERGSLCGDGDAHAQLPADGAWRLPLSFRRTLCGASSRCRCAGACPTFTSLVRA